MYTFLIDLGLKKYDLALLLFCPPAAMLGSFVHATLLVMDPQKLPRPGATRLASRMDAFGRFSWLFLRLSLGGILGLVVGLYFIGALQENITTLAKVIALSILIGFAAPKLWVAQELVLLEHGLKRIKELLEQQSAVKPPNL
jgi:hypothetical protein